MRSVQPLSSYLHVFPCATPASSRRGPICCAQWCAPQVVQPPLTDHDGEEQAQCDHMTLDSASIQLCECQGSIG